MSETGYGNVLIGLAGAPKSISSVVHFLQEVDDATVVSAQDVFSLTDTPPGLTVVPDLRTFKQKNHLMGIRGYLIWTTLPKYRSAITPAMLKDAQDAANIAREFTSADCHTVLDMDETWKSTLSKLHAAYQYRSVKG